jgi:hypothetical protein
LEKGVLKMTTIKAFIIQSSKCENIDWYGIKNAIGDNVFFSTIDKAKEELETLYQNQTKEEYQKDNIVDKTETSFINIGGWDCPNVKYEIVEKIIKIF